MVHGTAKVAISMPRDLFRSVEQARSKLHLARSEAVAAALQDWLKRQEEAEQIRRYIEGYRKHPESKVESKVWTRLATEVFHKDPW